MKAEELRIGNYVLQSTGWQEGENGKVRKFNELNFREMLDPDFKLVSGEFEPIPLTEEWLFKLGFNEFEKTKEYYKNNLFILMDNEDQITNAYLLNEGGSYSIDVFIEHVHQLQNLNFALTGIELKLKN